MRFKNHTTNQKLNIACAMADAMLNIESNLMQAVRQKHDWKYKTNMNGKKVANRLSQRPLEPIPVVLYRPLNPWSKARAMWDGEVISINTRYLNLESTTVAKLIGSLCHEWGHVCGFKHGNNYRTKDKEQYSVPYVLGIWAASGRYM